MISLLAIIVLFLLLSGIAALLDAAFLSVTHAEVQAMVNKSLPGAQYLQDLKQSSLRAVIVIVILTNAINVVGPIVVGAIAVDIFNNAILGVITAVLTFGTIVFSEILPKTIGTAYAPQVSRHTAIFLYICTQILLPIVWPLEKFITVFRSSKRLVGTEDQIRSLVQLGSKAGHIESEESLLIHSAFQLNDLAALDIMIPHAKIVWLDAHMTTVEAAQIIFDHPFSRYPLRGDFGTYVLSRDVLQKIAEGDTVSTLESIAHTAIVIDENFLLDELLIIFRRENKHLALVNNENAVIGLITLEDVLEQLVGAIEDEQGTK